MRLGLQLQKVAKTNGNMIINLYFEIKRILLEMVFLMNGFRSWIGLGRTKGKCLRRKIFALFLRHFLSTIVPAIK
jgi:hypothetical protein